jgi:hypothetical protein
MIEQIAAMLATIIGRREAGEVAAARQELENTCLQTIGLSLESIKGLSPEAVAQLLDGTGASRHVRAVTLAELLLLDAEWREADQGGSETMPAYVHAFCLLVDALSALSPTEQTLYRAKLDKLVDRLGEIRNHPYISERLRSYEALKVS